MRLTSRPARGKSRRRARHASVNPRLIFDCGMHRAGDTEFYLKKGYRVVAVEANARLCTEAAQRLASWVDAGQLFIVPFAITEAFGTRVFYINHTQDDWSSLRE